MKQIIQDLKSGETRLAELPAPTISKGHLLIRTQRSLVSLGTEKMLVDFGKAGWIAKARSQPEKVKQVLEKMRADGLRPTLEAVFRKLGEPLPLGYCNAGEVIGIGVGVSGFQIGDRVVSNGPHAEFVNVPENLVAKIPGDLSYDEAAFTVIGAIGLQGIRLLNPTFGETVVVTGLGLIGLLAAQLLKANGCLVIGLDFDSQKVALARGWGIEAIEVTTADPVSVVNELTNGQGADAVLITASTSSNSVISQAARMSRPRGRIVLVGVIGLDIQRADFYEKELSFQVSCSYGPGRYQEAYEQKGMDYPIAHVRWTENRNFQAVLQAMATGQLDVQALITETVELDNYLEIYGDLGKTGSIASILKYPLNTPLQRQISLSEKSFKESKAVLGIIGAGNFTKSTILPSLKKIGIGPKYIASSKGLSGTISAKKFGVAHSVTDYQLILEDSEIDAVIITTRHDVHASQVIEALEADKHVFVEKPLALSFSELETINQAYLKTDKSLIVGFNRRFSPHSIAIKEKLGNIPGPINVVATMNAGFIPADSWVHDLEIGGGRIIGEACHMIDLITFFTGSLVESVVMNALGPDTPANTDNASILLRYANGSQGVINYFSNGSKAYSKERVEVYSQQRTVVLDNFRRSHYYDFPGRSLRTRQDKGHLEQFRRYYRFLQNGGAPTIPYAEIMNTSQAALAAMKSLHNGSWEQLVPIVR